MRWLQEATGEARGRTRCRGAAGPSGPRVDVLLRPFVSWACRLPDTRQIAADAIFNFGLPTVHVSVQFGEAGARLIVPPHLTIPERVEAPVCAQWHCQIANTLPARHEGRRRGREPPCGAPQPFQEPERGADRWPLSMYAGICAIDRMAASP